MPNSFDILRLLQNLKFFLLHNISWYWIAIVTEVQIKFTLQWFSQKKKKNSRFNMVMKLLWTCLYIYIYSKWQVRFVNKFWHSKILLNGGPLDIDDVVPLRAPNDFSLGSDKSINCIYLHIFTILYTQGAHTTDTRVTFVLVYHHWLMLEPIVGI